MKKKLISFFVAAAMVMSMPTAIFASEAPTSEPAQRTAGIDGSAEISPMTTTSATVGATRISSTKGSVTAFASFSRKASKASCTVTLQYKSSGGSWLTATGLPVYSYIKRANNVYSISISKTFTLKKGKVYRAKVVFSDTNSDGTYYRTVYSGSF